MKGFSPSIRETKRSFKAKLFRELVVRSWWVLAFILLTFSVFHPILKHLDRGEAKLLTSLAQLNHEKESALKKKENLVFQIESQKDPYWIEMLLKKELGLVSEGQTKVHFLTH